MDLFEFAALAFSLIVTGVFVIWDALYAPIDED